MPIDPRAGGARGPGSVSEVDVAGLTGAAVAQSGGLDAALLGDYVSALTRVSATRTALNRTELEGYRRLGGEAADAGVPLPALIDLYLSVTWRLWRYLPAVTAAVPTLALVQAVGETVMRAAGEAVTAVSDGHQMARQAVIRRQEAARREFIDDLLTGSSDVSGLLARAAGFGLDLTGPHTVVLARASTAFTEGSAQLNRVESALSGRGSPPALVASKDGLLVVVGTVNAADAVGRIVAAMRGVLGPRATTMKGGAWQIGVGRVRPGPVGVLLAYEEARDALTLAGLLRMDTPVVAAVDLLVYRVLLRDRTAIADLILTTLGPLADARGGAAILLGTLDAYLDAGGNTAETARRLHLSVRAVTYRLARIREFTGLEPADTGVRITLHVAVLGARLLDWPATALPTPS
ncbi:sugar diacid utilization regulator [Actinokineospora auranticolor]|uniref:Sugar diacid utilization regulator n=1 Tax=Actinokineospora auranticolor TaxID=155976 RepID=A0A2S6GIT4_9PSEU|nr:sugar diacid utilization regulator [Actinokineospora auranticolor]